MDYTKFEVYIFDLDGTIFIEDELLPYAKETIEFLRKYHKQTLFLTNTTIRTRQEIKTKLAQFGINVDIEEIITSSFVSANYLSTLQPKPTVFVVGESSLREDLDSFHVKQTNDPKQASHVLVGIDFQFSYQTISNAMTAIHNGAILIGCNPDPFCPYKDSKIPDTGALLHAIETASETKASIIIGKPSGYTAKYIQSRIDFEMKQCLMIGDRMDTDISFGKNVGMGTMLVLTGAHQSVIAESTVKPDFIIENLEYFFHSLTGV